MSAIDPSAASTPLPRAVPAPRSWWVRVAGLAIGLGLLALSGFVFLDGPQSEPARPAVDPVVQPASVSP